MPVAGERIVTVVLLQCCAVLFGEIVLLAYGRENRVSRLPAIFLFQIALDARLGFRPHGRDASGCRRRTAAGRAERGGGRNTGRTTVTDGCEAGGGVGSGVVLAEAAEGAVDGSIFFRFGRLSRWNSRRGDPPAPGWPAWLGRRRRYRSQIRRREERHAAGGVSIGLVGAGRRHRIRRRRYRRGDVRRRRISVVVGRFEVAAAACAEPPKSGGGGFDCTTIGADAAGVSDVAIEAEAPAWWWASLSPQS